MKLTEVFNPDLIDDKDKMIIERDPTDWTSLYTWYNWNNIYNEILYFYDKDKDEKILKAFSISYDSSHKSCHILLKDFYYGNIDCLSWEADDWSDPWEIYEKDLEESDKDSLRDSLISIFKADNIIINKDAFSIF